MFNRSAIRISLTVSLLLLFISIIGPSVMAAGGELPRIILPPGYQAFVHADGLNSPDGLALSPAGILHVAEESAGRVVAVSEDGTLTLVADGISSPEGIAFDDAGNLYVVEDVQGGRLLRFDPQGESTVLAGGLDAPEGVTVETGGDLLITESNVQFSGSPLQYRTSVTRVLAVGAPETVESSVWFWSYAGITTDSAGTIYVTNEASGTGSTDSVFTIDPLSGTRTLFCSGLTACEGLNFGPDGNFPLLVAEEDLGSGNGRLTKVDAAGATNTFATGFFNIEDVIVDQMGRIFVSEDTSGMIIRIAPNPETISVDLSCQPGLGTLPLNTVMSVSLINDYQGQSRAIAARIDVTTATSLYFPHWKAGWTTVAAGDRFVATWSQTIPALGSLVGQNTFTLLAMDVTPSPWNQPPYPPAGNTATASCTVTGIVP
jgi:sugar lactone lactonase YvrE